MQYNKAVSWYSVALSLGPAATHRLFIKQSEVHRAKGSWEEASTQFCILCVGHSLQSGVGKSSLINCVFRITEVVSYHIFAFLHDAKIIDLTQKFSVYAPGESSINQEFVSDENQYIVLHNSNGFTPRNNTNLNLAAKFLQERNDKKLLKD
ncbi:hypothetical protein JVT61DRAFT_13408 [Boletus reticuloceps]|uniref:Uncharacterized protein n=1 Tax=Boletus reticuloceps TaxID=495285 RepID=A0A8I2YDF9_9AGAM|nr:hypothetical protein JVT61DRAFT_13408 [Boletus reticuloceps]